MQKQFATPDDSFRQNPNILEFEQLFDTLWYPYIINPFKEDRDDSPSPQTAAALKVVQYGTHGPAKAQSDPTRTRRIS